MSKRNWMMMTTCVFYFILVLITLSWSVLDNSAGMLLIALFMMWLLLLTMMGSLVYMDNEEQTPKGIIYLLYILMLPITIIEIFFDILSDLLKRLIFKKEGGDYYEE